MLLYRYKDTFIKHFLTEEEKDDRGTKLNVQRFEACLRFPDRRIFRFALVALLAKDKFKKSTQIAARELIMEAIADLTKKFENFITEDLDFDASVRICDEENDSEEDEEDDNDEGSGDDRSQCSQFVYNYLKVLKSMTVSVMFLDEALNDTLVAKIYEDLSFNETMNFLELQIEMESMANRFELSRTKTKSLDKKVKSKEL